MPYLNHIEFAKVHTALKAGVGMCENALPKFNWGASALDADAIQSLNETPAELRAALAACDDAVANLATPAEIAAASEEHVCDEIEIDGEGAGASRGDEGYWVQAWVWIATPQEDEDEDDCPTCAASTETRAAPCDECGHQDEPRRNLSDGLT